MEAKDDKIVSQIKKNMEDSISDVLMAKYIETIDYQDKQFVVEGYANIVLPVSRYVFTVQPARETAYNKIISRIDTYFMALKTSPKSLFTIKEVLKNILKSCEASFNRYELYEININILRLLNDMEGIYLKYMQDSSKSRMLPVIAG